MFQSNSEVAEKSNERDVTTEAIIEVMMSRGKKISFEELAGTSTGTITKVTEKEEDGQKQLSIMVRLDDKYISEKDAINLNGGMTDIELRAPLNTCSIYQDSKSGEIQIDFGEQHPVSKITILNTDTEK